METEIDRKQLEKIMFELIDGECNYCGKKVKKGKHFCSEECEVEYRTLENKVKLWD